jgi:hypothetical protein
MVQCFHVNTIRYTVYRTAYCTIIFYTIYGTVYYCTIIYCSTITPYIPSKHPIYNTRTVAKIDYSTSLSHLYLIQRIEKKKNFNL